MSPPRTAVIAGVAALALAMSWAPGSTLAADPVVIVRPGDTLTWIAERNGVTVQALAVANRLSNPDRIYPGQRLVVPDRSGLPAGSTQGAATAGGDTHGTAYLVRRGDNLWSIARAYGSSVAAIAAANAIADPSHIVAGQRLVIPAAARPSPSVAAPRPAPASPAAAAPTAKREGIVYVVRRGDNLWSIARAHGSTVAAIAAANAIPDPSHIVAGQRLLIPGASPAPGPAASVKPVPARLLDAMAARGAVARMIADEASAQGVPVAFALAVAWQESGWQPHVISHAGAVGVMQLLPSTAAWVASAMLGEPVDVHDPRSNIRAGIRLLRFYLDRYDGRRDLVLAAYYQGMTALERHGIYPVSRPYIASIRALEQLLSR